MVGYQITEANKMINKGFIQTKQGRCPVCMQLSMDVWEKEFSCRNCGYHKVWDGSTFSEIKTSLEEVSE
jgi:hypothetical protein